MQLEEEIVISNVYEIRFAGEAGAALIFAFESRPGVSVALEPGVTVLHCTFADQAELQGVIDTIYSFALHLLDVRLAPADVTKYL